MAKMSRTDDIKRFHRWSYTYERSWLQRFVFDSVHQAVLCAEPRSILDVGCGTGWLLRAAKARWPIYLKGNRFISHT